MKFLTGTRTHSLLIALAWTLAGSQCPAAEPGLLLPSEATTLMSRAIRVSPATARQEITRPIVARMQTTGLDLEERFLKSEAHFMDFDPEQARDGFWEFIQRSDAFGRVAMQRIMVIRVNAYQRFEQVLSEDIPEYRRRFGIDPNDRSGVSYPLAQVANWLIEQGEADRALDLVVEEVRAHRQFDAPYFAYTLPVQFMEAARAAGRGDEFAALLDWCRHGLSTAIKQRTRPDATPSRPSGDPLAGDTLGTLFYDRMLNAHHWTAEFLALRARME